MNKNVSWILLVFVGFAFLACTGSGMTGAYEEVDGSTRIVLKGNNTVDLEAYGMSFSGNYRIDAKNLIITVQGQNIKFSIVDKNTLACDVFGYEGTYKKK